MIETNTIGQTIVDYADSMGYPVRADYSGRGMHGEQCLGIVVQVPLAEMVAITAVVLENMQHEDDSIDAWDIVDVLEDVRTDNMGRNTILYWPLISGAELDVPIED